MNRILYISMLVALSTLASSVALSQTETEVAVFFHGPSDSVEVWNRSGAAAVLQGERSILNQPILGNDFKVLPLGQTLIGQASGAGFGIVGADRDLFYELDPSRRYRNVSSAAVVGFLGAGEVSRVAMADSYSSVVTIRELQSDQVVWFENMALTAGFPYIPSVIALPGDRVVIAANYPGVDITTINVSTFEFGTITRQQFANFQHAEAPSDVVVVPELQQSITSLMANSAGDALLIGQSQQLLMMGLDGQVLWVQPLSELLGVGGEVAGALLLRDGTVVFATFERGAWVEANINHKLHWYDPVSKSLLASTGPLRAAPAAIDLNMGHGGSGTLDFAAGVGEPEGSVDDLDLTQFSLGGTSFEIGDVISPRAVVLNEGDNIVTLIAARIVANPGACDAVSVSQRIWAPIDGVFGIYPSSTLFLQDEVSVPAGIELGAWCARVEVTNRNGDQLYLGAELSFTIAASGDGTGNVDVTPLPFDDLEDMGTDAGDMGVALPDSPPDEGCCSTVKGRQSRTPMLLWFGLVIVLWGRGRARR